MFSKRSLFMSISLIAALSIILAACAPTTAASTGGVTLEFGGRE